jgi:hypothetical protein
MKPWGAQLPTGYLKTVCSVMMQTIFDLPQTGCGKAIHPTHAVCSGARYAAMASFVIRAWDIPAT